MGRWRRWGRWSSEGSCGHAGAAAVAGGGKELVRRGYCGWRDCDGPARLPRPAAGWRQLDSPAMSAARVQTSHSSGHRRTLADFSPLMCKLSTHSACAELTTICVDTRQVRANGPTLATFAPQRKGRRGPPRLERVSETPASGRTCPHFVATTGVRAGARAPCSDDRAVSGRHPRLPPCRNCTLIPENSAPCAVFPR